MDHNSHQAVRQPRRRLNRDRLFVLIAVGTPTLLIFFIMAGFVGSVRAIDGFPLVSIDFQFPALFIANTPTGGDMGAHVLLPQILQDSLLGNFRIQGWSQAWYAGFPALFFYFPLPAMLTVILNAVLPYGVAFKLATIMGLVTMPAASYFFVRSMGFHRIVAGIAGFTGSMYVFMESFSILGGNIKSTLAGEFSFSWALSLSLVYLGIVIRDQAEGRRFSPKAGVVLALLAMSHIIPTALVVVVSLPLLLRKRAAGPLVMSWMVGFGIAAFWAVPLLLTASGMTSDMNWSPVRGLIGDGGYEQIATPLPNEFFPIFILGLLGMAWSVYRRENVVVPITMVAVSAVAYRWLPDWGLSKIYNGRLLPFWYVGFFIFAGIAIGLAVMRLSRLFAEREENQLVAGAVAVLLLFNISVAGIHDTPGWASWNYTGYEGKAAWPELEALLDQVDQLPEGRIMWEAASDELNKYGTPMALMLLPYFSPGRTSMEGLFFESSLTTPFHFLNAAEVSWKPSNPVRGLIYRNFDFERGIKHLELYGVSYYIAMTDEAKEEAVKFDLELISATPIWSIFKLPENQLVDAAKFEPVVYAGDESFVDASLQWYDDLSIIDRWMVKEGPESWQRVSTVGDWPPPTTIDQTVTVTDIVMDDNSVSFKTDGIGVPHLVKTSYFPNWTVEGADGPYRASPSLMIVVPTQENVVLQFSRSPAEKVGMGLTAATFLGLGIWAYRRREDQELVEA